jgi:hypothetical protein
MVTKRATNYRFDGTAWNDAGLERQAIETALWHAEQCLDSEAWCRVRGPEVVRRTEVERDRLQGMLDRAR